MTRLRLAVLTLVTFAALAGGVAAATSSRAGSAAGHVREDSFQSEALQGTMRFAVWLPPGYESHTHRRYPVLYMLHGLPGGNGSYRSLLFLAPVLNRLHAQALVVFPQAARPGDSDDEYLDLGRGRNWVRALTRELPAAVAARYRAIETRAARGIIGISAGGYGAAILGLHNLDRYRVIESWSGYFHATTPDGRSPMPLAPKVAQWADAHSLVPRLAARLTRNPTFIAFYTGRSDPYPGFVAENERFDRELSAAGIPHRFAVYPGGHDSALWLLHAPAWLRLALRALAPAR
ncbi:MAG TPA: alpha/beta hydrolase-fold protein [Gaiellaceae bacterium]|nr:alpha/beta hydrolase-fold protein [Gaiellaceae bacterium]